MLLVQAPDAVPARVLREEHDQHVERRGRERTAAGRSSGRTSAAASRGAAARPIAQPVSSRAGKMKAMNTRPGSQAASRGHHLDLEQVQRQGEQQRDARTRRRTPTGPAGSPARTANTLNACGEPVRRRQCAAAGTAGRSARAQQHRPHEPGQRGGLQPRVADQSVTGSDQPGERGREPAAGRARSSAAAAGDTVKSQTASRDLGVEPAANSGGSAPDEVERPEEVAQPAARRTGEGDVQDGQADQDDAARPARRRADRPARVDDLRPRYARSATSRTGSSRTASWRARSRRAGPPCGRR